MKWPNIQQTHKANFELKDKTILAGYVGSIAHGTSIWPKDGGIDDKDVMGIYVCPKELYLGLQTLEDVNQWVDEYDLVFYDVKKFIRLLLKNNPNVVGLLWLEPTLYVKKTPCGQKLIDNRDIFSSKQCYKSFIGYAYSQLKKMENCKHEGYMGEKRKQLVEKFGYDTKNAAHLIRLLRMGIEFLNSGEMNVQRHDAPQLIDIKQGKYKLEEIKAMATSLFGKAEDAFMASKLPTHPDFKKAEELLIEIIEEGIKGIGEKTK